jgi:Predicted integral membrane protein (DUF2269)
MIQLFLFLHVMGAIVAFGPSFTFPLIGSASAKEPRHAHFGAVVSEIIERRLVLPFAMLQGVTGVVLIILLGFNPAAEGFRWLGVGIILYLIAIGYAVAIQAKRAARMVVLTAMPPAPPAPGAPAGPPPEIAATAKGLQQGGMIMTVLLVLIVILMTTKPF